MTWNSYHLKALCKSYQKLSFLSVYLKNSLTSTMPRKISHRKSKFQHLIFMKFCKYSNKNYIRLKFYIIPWSWYNCYHSILNIHWHLAHRASSRAVELRRACSWVVICLSSIHLLSIINLSSIYLSSIYLIHQSIYQSIYISTYHLSII